MPADNSRRHRYGEDQVDARERDRNRPLHRSRSRSPARARFPARKRRPGLLRSPIGDRSVNKRTRDDRTRSSSKDRRDRDNDRHRRRPPSDKSADRRGSEEKLVFSGGSGMVVDDDEEDMAATMGFSSFNSSKGKKVEGNDIEMAAVAVKRKYRQYMNRRGGFNRPLDPVH